jgi:galactosamine-6-phosphate isomerase/glucosamine-6-phosphate deaminase
LAETTITVGQKYFTKPTILSKGITLGLKHLQEAKLPLLIAAGTKKAGIISQSLKEPIGTQVPASIFQSLPNGLALLDQAAASGFE